MLVFISGGIASAPPSPPNRPKLPSLPYPQTNMCPTTNTTTLFPEKSYLLHHSTSQPPPTRTPIKPAKPPSSTSSSSTQACAACKYQRRRCQPDCTLSPYFPADQQQTFLNAHRLFGVSNILKILKNLDPSLRPEAMRSIIFHSNTRAQDPIRGCYGVVLDLQRQIANYTAELDFIHQQIAVFRIQSHPQAGIHAVDLSTVTVDDHDSGKDNNEGDVDYQHQYNVDSAPTLIDFQEQQQNQQHPYLNYYYGNDVVNGSDEVSN